MIKWALLSCEFVGGPFDGDKFTLLEPLPGRIYKFTAVGPFGQTDENRILLYRFHHIVAALAFCGYG